MTKRRYFCVPNMSCEDLLLKAAFITSIDRHAIVTGAEGDNEARYKNFFWDHFLRELRNQA